MRLDYSITVNTTNRAFVQNSFSLFSKSKNPVPFKIVNKGRASSGLSSRLHYCHVRCKSDLFLLCFHNNYILNSRGNWSFVSETFKLINNSKFFSVKKKNLSKQPTLAAVTTEQICMDCGKALARFSGLQKKNV